MQSLGVLAWIVIGMAAGFVILFCWILYIFFYVRSLRSAFNAVSENMEGIADLLAKFKGEVRRWDYVSKAVVDSESSNANLQLTVGELGRKIAELEQKLDEVQMQEPESKMYNRAVKMAKSGASLKDIMEECELPQPEAELLISIHAPGGSSQNKSKKNLNEL